MSKPSSAARSIVRIEKSVTTHCQTTSGVTCHHRILTAHTIERRRAWHAIITFGQHTRSNYIGRGMPSYYLDDKHNRTKSSVACHHRLWTTCMVQRRQVGHSIITFGPHTRSKDVGRDMTSTPLDSTHGQTTSVVTCHHRFWTAHTVERRPA